MITLTRKQLADLFYGYKKPIYEEAILKEYENQNEVDELVEKPLLEYAEEFSKLIGGQLSANDIISDFKERLDIEYNG